MYFAKLDAGVEASGPHDFAVRKQALSSLAPPRPLHPAPNVRDDRETPLFRERDGASYRSDLGREGTNLFLQTGLDRKAADLPVGQIRS
jgi:hypothetical protein